MKKRIKKLNNNDFEVVDDDLVKIYVEYPSGTVYEYGMMLQWYTVESAKKLIAELESCPDNYNLIFTYK